MVASDALFVGCVLHIVAWIFEFPTAFNVLMLRQCEFAMCSGADAKVVAEVPMVEVVFALIVRLCECGDFIMVVAFLLQLLHGVVVHGGDIVFVRQLGRLVVE